MSNTSYDPAEQPKGTASDATEPTESVEIVPVPYTTPVVQATTTATVVSGPPTTRGMYTAAAVINWVTLAIIIAATFGFGIVAAAWFIPMTIMIHKGAKGPFKHTSLGVCTLLFCNIISGILMLVDDSDRPAKPVS